MKTNDRFHVLVGWQSRWLDVFGSLHSALSGLLILPETIVVICYLRTGVQSFVANTADIGSIHFMFLQNLSKLNPILFVDFDVLDHIFYIFDKSVDEGGRLILHIGSCWLFVDLFMVCGLLRSPFYLSEILSLAKAPFLGGIMFFLIFDLQCLVFRMVLIHESGVFDIKIDELGVMIPGQLGDEISVYKFDIFETIIFPTIFFFRILNYLPKMDDRLATTRWTVLIPLVREDVVDRDFYYLIFVFLEQHCRVVERKMMFGFGIAD